MNHQQWVCEYTKRGISTVVWLTFEDIEMLSAFGTIRVLWEVEEGYPI
jgi:hypothetical protein